MQKEFVKPSKVSKLGDDYFLNCEEFQHNIAKTKECCAKCHKNNCGVSWPMRRLKKDEAYFLVCCTVGAICIKRA